MVFQAAKRIAQLDAAHEGLVFGRLDLDASIDTVPRYIGRIGLRDAQRDTLLIDWRAPARSSFSLPLSRAVLCRVSKSRPASCPARSIGWPTVASSISARRTAS